MARQTFKRHRIGRIDWLRAAVLGANDGIISTASLILGVASAAAAPDAVLPTGLAGLVAGAMSMAAGEYVSVSSQADTEQADSRSRPPNLSATRHPSGRNWPRSTWLAGLIPASPLSSPCS